jgi:hypothetical protein
MEVLQTTISIQNLCAKDHRKYTANQMTLNTKSMGLLAFLCYQSRARASFVAELSGSAGWGSRGELLGLIPGSS